MDEKLLDFEELFQIFKKLWWIIILCVCITTGLSAYKANKMQPSYSSKVSIFLGMNSQTMDYSTVQQVYFYKNNMGLFKDMIVTEDFYEDVVEKNKFNVSPSEIASCVSFSYAEETPIMYIQYKSLKKENIDKILDAVALEFVERYKEVVVDSSPNIVNSAVVSTAYPNKRRIIIIGFIVGLIAGIGIIFVVDYLDDRIKSRERLEKILDIPVLGAIPTQEKEFGKAGKRYVHSRKNATIGIS
ncbi:YveK family protein [Clostridium celatum]|uniref:YveK family protein n=1 Tax=Clostridium celatum TaxID=36834 RepID=UPI001898ACCE|nr:Wzz/FepE/Etk N-terminal domain-containing protein [Clostridium celatum]MCE9656388.1 Wzz/FepE/Etk N-terminal domain-containing protein [Clostridium celatum]